jgi:hypothetical protein
MNAQTIIAAGVVAALMSGMAWLKVQALWRGLN